MLFPVGRWQFRHLLPLYHLCSTEVTSAPSLSSFRKLRLQHKHSCLSSRSWVSRWGVGEQREAVPGGWAAPASGHRWKTQDTPDCPLDHWRQQVPAQFFSSLLSTSHHLFSLWQILWAEPHTDPACLDWTKGKILWDHFYLHTSPKSPNLPVPYAHLCYGHCDILAQKKIEANTWFFFMHHIMIFFFCIKLEQFFLKWGKKAL